MGYCISTTEKDQAGWQPLLSNPLRRNKELGGKDHSIQMAHSNINLLSLEGSRVRHLRFEDMGPNTLKASWDSADGKVLGYRVRCRRQTGPSSVISVSPQIHSVLLTDLASGTTNKVCVKPMYKNQPGKRLCRMVHMQPGELGCRAESWGTLAKGKCPEGH